MTRAREIMVTDIITVTPATPLLQVQRLFLESEINGAPVVDESGTLLGVVSSLDLVRAVQEGYDTGAAYTDPVYFRHDVEFSGPDWLSSPEDLQDRLADMTVDDIMVTEMVTVPPDADVADVARTMRDQRVHRVLVVDNDRLAGLISTFDLIELIATPEPERPYLGEPSPSPPGPHGPTPEEEARMAREERDQAPPGAEEAPENVMESTLPTGNPDPR